MILFPDYDDTRHPSRTCQEKEGRLIACRYEVPWLVEAPTLERLLLPYLPRTES